jgi:branched-chain amino acid transport system permease protein
MEYYFSQFINGLSQGAIYALMAIGFTVVVGVTGLVTFVHGEVIMLGAFAAYYTFTAFGNNLFLGIIASFTLAWVVGVLIYKICFQRFLNCSSHISLICTIGMSMFLKNMVQIVCGPNYRPMLNVINNDFYGFGVIGFTRVQLVIIATVASLSLLLFLLLNKTQYGIKLRAVCQDKKAAAVMGINVQRTAMEGHCLGCGLGGVAGMLMAIYYQTLVATMGGTACMKAFAASVLGGLVDIPCAALGGLCLGIVENLGITLASASFRDIFAFAFLVLMLVIKPEGFAKKKGVKV